MKDIVNKILDKLEPLKSQILIFTVIVIILGLIFALSFPSYVPWILVGFGVLILISIGVYVSLEIRSTRSKAPEPFPLPAPNSPPPDASKLQQNYLEWLLQKASRLNLEGINLRDAGQEAVRLSLDAVYTALLTITPEAQEKMERGQQVEPPERKSALEELNDKKHLLLLGDPGSGKSTFVNFVAMCLAGACLERNDINLELLTKPLPDDEGNDQDHRQSWLRGALLPVRIILRDFAASGLLKKGQPVTLEHLWTFLTEELKKASLEEYVPFLRRQIIEQGGLLLFDGLDEVPEAQQHRQQIIQLVEAAAALPCRILVTARTYAYKKEDWALTGFAVAFLDSFSKGQIIRFVDRWYAHLAQLGAISDPGEAKANAELLKDSIFKNERIYVLAKRPLLLTLMAGLHAWHKGKLPEKRELLYHETVELLIDRWQRQTIIHHPDGSQEMLPSLEEFLKVGKENVRRALNELAFNAHKEQSALSDTADIAEKDLIYALLSVSPVKEETKPELLASYLRDRAGILVERGGKVYTFPHRTFQEYLAACYLTDTDFPEKLAELACQDQERWREVTLLAGAKVARGSDGFWLLAEWLCGDDLPRDGTPPDEKALWGAFLAGQVLYESAQLNNITPRNRKKLERIKSWLVYILQHGSLSIADRAAAGITLDHFDDPRFDNQHCYLPVDNALLPPGQVQHPDVFGFVLIPAGSFRMGSRKGDPDAYDDEYDQHEVPLADFYLARTPVTVDQFKCFVDEARPSLQGNPDLKAPGNHPVVNVSWHDAMQYCHWLTKKLHEYGKLRLAQSMSMQEREMTFWNRIVNEGWRVMLPSEAEWEKAARGPLVQSPSYPPVYPWGDEFDPDCANTAETGLGTTSTVGCFPKGKSFYEILDLSGNVWEWTRSLWGENYEKPKFKYPYNPDDRKREKLNAPGSMLRVLRGGSFIHDRGLARCAYRGGGVPNLWFVYYGFRVGVVSPISISGL